jgi:hypothetical protein
MAATSATPFSPQVEGPQIGPRHGDSVTPLLICSTVRRETPRTAATAATRALLRRPRDLAVHQTAGNQSRPFSRAARTFEALRAALEVASVIFIDENGEGPDGRVRKATNPPGTIAAADLKPATASRVSSLGGKNGQGHEACENRGSSRWRAPRCQGIRKLDAHKNGRL